MLVVSTALPLVLFMFTSGAPLLTPCPPPPLRPSAAAMTTPLCSPLTPSAPPLSSRCCALTPPPPSLCQSLLCSELPSAEDRRNIGQFLAAHPSAVGGDALLALCSELGPAAEIIAEKYPEAALEHAKVRRGHDRPVRWPLRRWTEAGQEFECGTVVGLRGGGGEGEGLCVPFRFSKS